ncbi:hypothetical protein AB0M43_23935 [Longispora sp. NPDC051575]|uniref:hypothetical protein n=1 Tax=Longispora sp. NPDC051575 TaxID=3154943 RepID=UPI0034331079
MMDTRIVLPLSSALPPIAATVSVNPSTGRATYRVTGRRLAGAFDIYPHTDQHAAMPNRLTVITGTGTGTDGVLGRRANLPVVNGITVRATATWTVDQINARAPLGPRRATMSCNGRSRRASAGRTVPIDTASYTAAIMSALVRDYATRTDLPDLLAAAALVTGPTRLRALNTHTIQPLAEQISDLTARLATHESVAAELAALLGQHPTRNARRPRRKARRRRMANRRPGRRAGSRAPRARQH